MKRIELPHKVNDFTCPINGIEDLYEHRTGVRLPDFFLFYLGLIGFTYIRQKNAPAPRMVFWGSKTGKPQHEFLGEVMGYRWTFSEGEDFDKALREVKTSIERGNPPILGLLDMYHLPYFDKFYHRMHIPQHYVLMVGYDDERGLIFVQDNNFDGVQEVPYPDLKEAWNVHNPGQGTKNTYTILEFEEKPASLEEMLRKGLKKRAEVVLNPPVSFMGLPGMRRFATDFPHWKDDLDENQFRESLMHLVTFTCSVGPMPPQRLLNFPLNLPDPHQGTRDRFAACLEAFAAQFGCPQWKSAAEHFAESGRAIGEITKLGVDALLGKEDGLKEVPALMGRVLAVEERAYQFLLE